jgi:hypothetical protein
MGKNPRAGGTSDCIPFFVQSGGGKKLIQQIKWIGHRLGCRPSFHILVQNRCSFQHQKGRGWWFFFDFYWGHMRNVIICLSYSHLQNANIKINFARFVLNSVPSEFLCLFFFSTWFIRFALEHFSRCSAFLFWFLFLIPPIGWKPEIVSGRTSLYYSGVPGGKGRNEHMVE